MTAAAISAAPAASGPAPAPVDPQRASDARFWGGLAARYARMQIRDEDSYREKLRMTQAALPPEAEIFEFGCGTGATALEHAPFAARILATDIAEEMLQIARTRASEQQVRNVAFACGGLEDFPAAPRYDAVLGLNVLHLTPDPEAALRRAAAMTKPGGIVVTSTMCLADALPWFRPIAWAGRKIGKLPRIRFFSQSELERMHLRVGLEIETRWQPKRRAALFLIARKAR